MIATSRHRRRVLVCVDPDGVITTYAHKSVMCRKRTGFSKEVVKALKLPATYKGHWLQWSIIQHGDTEDNKWIRKYQKELLDL